VEVIRLTPVPVVVVLAAVAASVGASVEACVGASVGAIVAVSAEVSVITTAGVAVSPVTGTIDVGASVGVAGAHATTIKAKTAVTPKNVTFFISSLLIKSVNPFLNHR
jgi:hypothetical protein